MAKDLRSRRALIAALLAGACGQEPRPPAPPSPPRAVDTATLAAGEVAAAVLAECHAPLRGAMSRVAATVTLPDGSVVQLFAELPHKLRVQSPGGRFLLRDGTVLRLDADAPAATPVEVERVRALGTLLDAAAFGPLHRATGCRRLGPSTFELTGADGAATVLALRPGTLLPASFEGPRGTVTVVDYLRTQTTWIARELASASLGRCRVHFDSGRIDWAPDFFAPPTPTLVQGSARPRLPVAGAAVEPQSPTPVLVDGKPMRWVVVRDPGDWPGRVAAYRPLHDELARQDQAIAGFPVFWQADGLRWLAAPFRQRPEGVAFAAPAGWQVRDVPGGAWLVVYPPDGDLAQKLAAGERLLQDALRTQQLTARGPITAQPFLHLQEGEPAAAKLAAPKVRMAVPVE